MGWQHCTPCFEHGGLNHFSWKHLEPIGLAAQSGKGVVVVLHQLNAAARLADDLLLLKQGRVCGFGPCSEVLTSEALMATFGMAMEIVNLDGRTAILPR